MSGAEEGAYAVIFTSRRAPGTAPGAQGEGTGGDGYDEVAARMLALARDMPGYLGHDSARGADGFGITVSYWRGPEDIARWRAHPEHARVIAAARAGGWYEAYESVTTRVERIARR